MIARRVFMSFMIAGLVGVGSSLFAVNVASAGDGCGGTVRGLSDNYNLRRGTGFLAVRSRPSSSSRMRDQLFNGERVRIFGRRGNWYEISYSRGTGWAFARYVRNDCNY